MACIVHFESSGSLCSLAVTPDGRGHVSGRERKRQVMYEGWMFGMGWVWILLALLLGAAIFVALRAAGRSAGGTGAESPEAVLKRRYARGEIDRQEYIEKLRDLRD